jgi:hypothetical protein
LATTCTQTGEVFGRATLGAIQSASLAVGLIGQGPALARRRLTKHAVKQVDRLLSNEGIESMPCWRIWCLTWSELPQAHRAVAPSRTPPSRQKSRRIVVSGLPR